MSTAPVELPEPVRNAPSVDVELRLLGGFELCVAGVPVDLTVALQRLVSLIAVHGKPIPRALAAGVLWPERSEARAHANLRSCLWRLNEPGPPPVVVSRGSCLALHPDASVDICLLERLGWAIVEDPGSVDAHQNAELFVHPLLPGWYDDWIVMERERLAQLQARFLEGFVTALVAARELTHALDYAVRLVRADPLRERSQLCLLRVYAAEGSWGQLHEQLAAYEGLLRNTFGCGMTRTFRSKLAELMPDVAAGDGSGVLTASGSHS